MNRKLFYSTEFKEIMEEVLPALASSLKLKVVTGTAAETTPEFDALLTGSGDTPDVETVSENDTALLMFTSGTTGNPKRCMITHGGIYNYVNATLAYTGRMQHVRFLACHPNYHTSAIICQMVGTMSGTTFIMTDNQDPVENLKLIEKKNSNHHGAASLFHIPAESMGNAPD